MLAARSSSLYRQIVYRRTPLAQTFSSRRNGNDDDLDWERSSTSIRTTRDQDDDDEWDWKRSSKRNTKSEDDGDWDWERSSKRSTRDRDDEGRKKLSFDERQQIARDEARQIIESCKNGILMVVNSSTTFDFDPEIPSTAMKELQDLVTDPGLCTNKTSEIVTSMKHMQPRQLRQMFRKEYEYNQAVEYWENFMTEGNTTLNGAKPCLFTFQGNLWKDLSPLSRSKKALMYLQENLRILDPVYGVLKPLDRIQPYKLDMQVEYALGYSMNLRDFWSETITNVLRQELEKKPECMILNFCAESFLRLIDREKLPKHCRITTVQGNQVPGNLISYMAEALITDPEKILSFRMKKMEFQTSKSTPENLVWDISSSKPKTGATKRFKGHPLDD